MNPDDKNKKGDECPEPVNPKKRTFREELKHAFGVRPPEEEFSETDLKLIDDVAKSIVDRQMAAPAIIFLVSIKPISFFMSQGMHMIKPFLPMSDENSSGKQFAQRFMPLSLITNPQIFERFAFLMENHEGVEILIEKLEKFEDDRVGKERQEKQNKKSTKIKKGDPSK